MLAGILVAIIAVGIFFALTGGSSQIAVQSSGADSAVNKESINKLSVLEQYLDRYYYKSSEITKEDKENGIYKGLFESLGDVYSCYYTPEEYKVLAEQTKGVYYGIGAYVTGFDIDEVVSHIRGEEGTEVTLTLVRSGEEIEVSLKRARVDTPTVDSELLDNGIGYLQITEFDDVTVGQFTENLEQLREQGMKGLIIDLRGNPGGSVTSVCSVADHLLPDGLIFYMEDKDGNRTEYNCEGVDFGLPLVVLVNEYSASAAEILSGAVKDSGIGKLVGKRTFGKGIVQDVIPLQDGSAFKLTVANYYTRGGNDIHLKGIEPDIEVELDTDAFLEDGTDTQLDKAVEVILEEIGSKEN